MNILKNFIIALLLGPAMVAHSQANTEVTVEIANNTRGTMKMNNLLTDPPQAEDFSLSAHDIDPKSTYRFHIEHFRDYTYPGPGWRPTLKKVKPVELVLNYEMSHFNFECQMHTRLQVSIVPGALEPSYKPTWKSNTTYTGNGEYTCRSEISRKMLEPPFNYTVRLIIEPGR
ncbi:hypothetical protein SAMN03159488_04765 [Pseudomonas sp. NFIX10]|uniref:hypothetical protein n=1 Tax=unclassified Pseudomonas TaxID=196821 RepID=UPI0008ED747C|nr:MULTISPECIES: hypothetical protein [unclassified Pseudomonas]SFB52520.1 hypothetical protein SAMN03159488_04765 [Pseudomonas sp. NFIX10]SFF35770.1 hypothetical protein SAMN03159367_04130 [Pseudomonas sp. NFACC06-1]